MRVVDSLDEAIAFIAPHGSGLADAIVTEDDTAARALPAEVDSAAVFVNASTRFTDGFEFGFGAEIGICTNRLHARGPMGLRELTTYKYLVRRQRPGARRESRVAARRHPRRHLQPDPPRTSARGRGGARSVALDEVAFVPAIARRTRRTDGSRRPSTASRMVELAIAGNPAFYASSVEIDRGGVSYSIDTVETLTTIERGKELFFIVGIDAFGEMQTWKDAARLFSLANVVVTNRPPRATDTSIEHLPVAAREAFCYDPRTLSYRHRSGTRLHFHPITALDISATALRERVRRDQSIRYLVPPGVEQYIREHGLYRSGESIG